jgi:DNA-binding beta-propeller fold protein YncE
VAVVSGGRISEHPGAGLLALILPQSNGPGGNRMQNSQALWRCSAAPVLALFCLHCSAGGSDQNLIYPGLDAGTEADSSAATDVWQPEAGFDAADERDASDPRDAAAEDSQLPEADANAGDSAGDAADTRIESAADAGAGKVIYVTDFGGGQVYQIDPQAVPGGSVAWSRAVSQPGAVLATRDGGVVVAGQVAGPPRRWVLTRFDAEGNSLWTHGCCDDSQFSSTSGMSEDALGGVWVSDRFNGRVFRLDAAGNIAVTVPFGASDIGASGTVGPVVVLPSGSIMVFTDSPSLDSSRVWRIGPNGDRLEDATITGKILPMHATIDPQGGTDAMVVGFPSSIQMFTGIVAQASIASQSMTDEFGAVADGSFWRVYEDEPLVLLFNRTGTETLRLDSSQLTTRLGAFNAAHGTSFGLSGDFNRLAVDTDGSVYVPTHTMVMKLMLTGELANVIPGFVNASDVDLLR